MTNDPEHIDDDGLILPDVGDWAGKKYRFIETYLEIFSAGMKKKWGKRVYVDVCSGAGLARLRDRGEIVKASPMLAMSQKAAFDLCVFADADKEKLDALAKRASREFPNREIRLVQGDCNENVRAILRSIPEDRPGSGVLTLCLVDPYKIRDIAFSTIAALATRRMDFLVVVPTYMDANRNLETYVQNDDDSIGGFTGAADWRTRWMGREDEYGSFGDFVMREFARSMVSLGYLPTEMENTKVIRSSKKNLPLYHLAFFSKHKTGKKFWLEALKYGDNQLDLFR